MVAVLVVLALAVLVWARPRVRPSILLLSVDALRPDHLGCYGYARATSPAIDRFAAEGTRFETAISQATWTLPSVSSLFLSQYVSTHGIENPNSRIPEEAETLAERLAAAGYQTAAFVMGAYTSEELGMAQGFDVFVAETSPISVKNEALLGWLAEAEGTFFAYVHYVDVHHPYRERNPYGESFGRSYRGPVAESVPLGRLGRLEDHDLQHLADLYDNGVAYVDAHLAELFAALDRLEREEGLVVILTADHGEAFQEHDGMLGHRGLPYDELARVPLIFEGRGVPRGRVVSGFAEAVDLAPTILDFAGIRDRDGMQGQSLVPALRAGDTGKRFAFSEMLPWRATAVWSAEWKLLLDARDGSKRLFRNGEGERRDWAADHPEIVRSLLRVLAEQLAANRSLGAPSPETAEWRESTREQLRALGYLP